VEAGSIRDDLGRISLADWIIEAVAERADSKFGLFARSEGQEAGCGCFVEHIADSLQLVLASMPDFSVTFRPMPNASRDRRPGLTESGLASTREVPVCDDKNLIGAGILGPGIAILPTLH
jgi:hypothetical protein